MPLPATSAAAAGDVSAKLCEADRVCSNVLGEAETDTTSMSKESRKEELLMWLTAKALRD
jgi:hypothetical protein